MFCGKCGKKIDDGAKFCPYCGAASEPVQVSQGQASAPSDDLIVSALNTPTATPASEAAVPAADGTQILGTGSKRRGMGLLAGIAAVAVVVIVAAVVLFSGLLGGPKSNLDKAVTKSVSAFAAASDAAGFPDMKELTKDQKFRQEMSLELKSISNELTAYTPELLMLEGVGFRMSEGLNLPDKKLDMSMAMSYDGSDLLSAWVDMNDAVWTFSSPELLGGDVYGFNTMTLGKDINPFDSTVPEDMGFNLFDLLEPFMKSAETDTAALKDLHEAMEVEKMSGKSTIEVNDHNLECTGYHVVIPKDAMRDFLDAMEDIYAERGLGEAFADLLRSLGASSSEAKEIEEAMDGKAAFDALKQAVKTIGDLELDVYVSDGYVMAVEWEEKIDGTRMELGAYFGGGKNYADDLSIDLRIDDSRIRCASTGNHGTNGGEYTDETTIRIQDGGETVTVTSELSYSPKKSSDNFEWTVKSEGYGLTVEGQLTTGKNSVSLDIDKLSVNAMNIEMVRLTGSYALEPYSAPSYSSKSPTLLADMDEDDLMDISYDISLNLQDWAMGLLNDYPELAQLF